MYRYGMTTTSQTYEINFDGTLRVRAVTEEEAREKAEEVFGELDRSSDAFWSGEIYSVVAKPIQD